MNFTDKVCIVTGAVSGIGLGIARRFAAAGARVAIADRNAQAAQAAAEEIVADFRMSAMAVTMDVISEMRSLAALPASLPDGVGPMCWFPMPGCSS